MGLGELGQFFAWVDRERPSPEAQRAVRAFLAEAGAEPWLAPSTPIAELSSQPDDEVRSVLTEARRRAGLTGTELARRCGTSRPTLSAYEHGHVSPTLDTAQRVLDATGHRLSIVRRPTWQPVPVGRGRTASVPDQLPQLPTRDALRRVELPLHLDWSSRDRWVDLADRRQRLRTYETILREGRPEDFEAFVDGALLVDGWDELVLPRRIRAAWQPLIDEVINRG